MNDEKQVAVAAAGPAPCVIDTPVIRVRGGQVTIVIFIYGVFLTLLLVGVTPLLAVSTAVSAGYAVRSL